MASEDIREQVKLDTVKGEIIYITLENLNRMGETCGKIYGGGVETEVLLAI